MLRCLEQSPQVGLVFDYYENCKWIIWFNAKSILDGVKQWLWDDSFDFEEFSIKIASPIKERSEILIKNHDIFWHWWCRNGLPLTDFKFCQVLEMQETL